MTLTNPVSSRSHLKLCVQYLVPKDSLDDFIRDVGKYSRFIDPAVLRKNRQSSPSAFCRREARLMALLRNVPAEWHTLPKLHSHLRRRHLYPTNFSTYRRGVMELGIRELAETRVERRGKNNDTTLIRSLRQND